MTHETEDGDVPALTPDDFQRLRALLNRAGVPNDDDGLSQILKCKVDDETYALALVAAQPAGGRSAWLRDLIFQELHGMRYHEYRLFKEKRKREEMAGKGHIGAPSVQAPQADALATLLVKAETAAADLHRFVTTLRAGGGQA